MPSPSIALRYARALERATIATAPFDADLAQLLREMDDVLRAATAYVESFTPNGAQEQPPTWAFDSNGTDFDVERIATRCRRVLRTGSGA